MKTHKEILQEIKEAKQKLAESKVAALEQADKQKYPEGGRYVLNTARFPTYPNRDRNVVYVDSFCMTYEVAKIHAHNGSVTKYLSILYGVKDHDYRDGNKIVIKHYGEKVYFNRPMGHWSKVGYYPSLEKMLAAAERKNFPSDLINIFKNLNLEYLQNGSV